MSCWQDMVSSAMKHVTVTKKPPLQRVDHACAHVVQVTLDVIVAYALTFVTTTVARRDT